MQKRIRYLSLLSLYLVLANLRGAQIFAAPPTAPCDMYASGVNFGNYRAGQNSATGRIGIACKSSGISSIYCIGFDSGNSYYSNPNNPYIPKDGEAYPPTDYINYHVYMPITGSGVIWGNNKTIAPNQSGGIYCFNASSCTETSPCEFPVFAITDINQTSPSPKPSGGYSYVSGGSHPFFVLYGCNQTSINSCYGGALTITNIYEHFMASAYVSSGCSVSALPFNFGSVNNNSFNQCVTRQNLITVTCSGQSTYKITLVGGVKDLSSIGLNCPANSWCMGNYTNIPWSYLTYNLYQGSSCGTKWDDSHFLTCTSGCSNSLAYSVSGMITGASSGAPSGFYEDIVNVIVSY